MKIPETALKYTYYVALSDTEAYSSHHSLPEATQAFNLLRRHQPKCAVKGILEVFKSQRWAKRIDADPTES